MIHQNEETYITRRGEVRYHKGIPCRMISAQELVKLYPSLRVNKQGHVVVPSKRKRKINR